MARRTDPNAGLPPFALEYLSEVLLFPTLFPRLTVTQFRDATRVVSRNAEVRSV